MRHGQQVGHRAAVATTGRTEPEGSSGRRPVGGTGGEPTGPTRPAVTARHLKRHQHPLAGVQCRAVLADLDDLGDALVAHAVRTGKQPVPRHRHVEIAPGDRERSDQRTGRG